MKTTLNILEHIKDLILFCFLVFTFFYSIEFVESIVPFVTIIIAVKLMNTLIIRRYKSEYAVVLVVLFIIISVIELLIDAESIYAFYYCKAPLLIYSIPFIISIILSVIKTKTPLIK